VILAMARARFLFALALAAAAYATPVRAVLPDEVLSNPALEARARNLSRELRCMVCQNQSIDDSDAPLARDLRILVRERLQAGDNDRQVLDFLTARYGEFVLLRPALSWHTAALWGAPALVLILGAIGLVVVLRRRAPAAPPPALSAAEAQRIDDILRQEG
jgi:cytochrome c-type biogenesis protein CcmH